MINTRLVLRLVAAILIVISAFMATSIVWAWWYAEQAVILAFAYPILGTVTITTTFLYFSRRPGARAALSTRDGFLFVSAAWLSASAIGALPFVLSGYVPSYVDAVFETMSGFSTTGASILTDIEALPKALLWWRSLTHWLGGMGIIVLTVAILPLLGVGGLQLIKAEAPGPTVDRLTPKIAETAKILWLTYVIMSLLQIVLLMVGGMDLFDAATHTFGTVATGGFSPKNASVGHYGSAFIDVVITVFMVAAGINFVTYFKVATGRFGPVWRDGELRTYLLIFAGAALVTGIDLTRSGFGPFGYSLRYGAFQVASILTTTGYATTDFAVWPALAQITLFVLMFVGGCSGSTGGGMKVVRIVTLIKQGFNEMRYLIYPSGIFPVKLSGERVRTNIVTAISGFVLLYLTILLITTTVVAAAGNDILTSLTTALATLGNIGPGFGAVGPTHNYAFFPDYLKVFLTFIMMIGRLEIYTVLVLLTPLYWRRQ